MKCSVFFGFAFIPLLKIHSFLFSETMPLEYDFSHVTTDVSNTVFFLYALGGKFNQVVDTLIYKTHLEILDIVS